jgi:signal peptidase I
MGKTKRGEEADENGWTAGDPSGGVPSGSEAVGASDEKEKSTLREYAETLVIAIILALLIRTFVVQAFKIPSGSMIPTLSIGDHILVNKFIYGVRIPFTDKTLIPILMPKHGDVIVFRFPEDESKDFIKRVVGIPGDTIQIRSRVVYRNGVPQKEGYINTIDSELGAQTIPGQETFGPITVPPDSYFVMGDNRDHSLDSRFWGFVHSSKIKGEAFIIYWSWDSDDSSVRFRRIGKMIH